MEKFRYPWLTAQVEHDVLWRPTTLGLPPLFLSPANYFEKPNGLFLKSQSDITPFFKIIIIMFFFFLSSSISLHQFMSVMSSA